MSMRIIAGKHRGRVIRSTDDKEFRPTMGRTREALFSILTSGQFLHEEGTILEGATVLDLCCGTGALGLEALSRGAESVIFVDINQNHLEMARSNAAAFGEKDRCRFLRADAGDLPKAHTPCDVVLFDPPYQSKWAHEALKSLTTGGWLKKGSVVVMELDKRVKVEIPAILEVLMTRVYGKTQLTLLAYTVGDS